MKFREIQNYLEQIAPLSYQESYDNSGLLVGDSEVEVSGILVCLDITEEVIDEAINLGYNAIVTHHPIIFKGLKKLTGSNYVERCVIKAIKNDILLYAIHTNLDNVGTGINRILGEKLGLENLRILDPKKDILKKLVTFVPVQYLEEVRKAVFDVGAGAIGNYDQCSFNVEGEGTFRGNEKTHAFVGEVGQLHKEKEVRIETIFPAYLKGKILAALKKAHPYEEVAYDIYSIDNEAENIGAGMMGELPKSSSVEVFLLKVKEILGLEAIKYTPIRGQKIQRVAYSGGSGSFLINSAMAQGADLFLTGDLTYHQYFEHENKMVIADIGHYESEQFGKELIFNFLIQKFPNFAVRICEHNTNPVSVLK